MEENEVVNDKVVKNEKWKKVLLTVALAFQCMRIIIPIVCTILQKTLINWYVGKTQFQNVFVLPIGTITATVISSLVFLICYLLLKNNKNEKSIAKEILCIVLAVPISSLLINISTIFIRLENIQHINISNFYGYYSNMMYLDNIIAWFLTIFNYSLIILAITAGISIGKKRK